MESMWQSSNMGKMMLIYRLKYYYFIILLFFLLLGGCQVQEEKTLCNATSVSEKGETRDNGVEKDLSAFYPQLNRRCRLFGLHAEAELSSIIVTLKEDSEFSGGIFYVDVKWDEFPIFAEILTSRHSYKLTKYNYEREWVILEKGDLYFD